MKLNKLMKQRQDKIDILSNILQLSDCNIKKSNMLLQSILSLNKKIKVEEDSLFNDISEKYNPVNKKLLNRYSKTNINPDNYLTIKIKGNTKHPTKKQKIGEQGIAWIDNKTGNKITK
jgi:hypothetical protein